MISWVISVLIMLVISWYGFTFWYIGENQHTIYYWGDKWEHIRFEDLNTLEKIMLISLYGLLIAFLLGTFAIFTWCIHTIIETMI